MYTITSNIYILLILLYLPQKWDGVASSDKEYQRIYGVVERAIKAMPVIEELIKALSEAAASDASHLSSRLSSKSVSGSRGRTITDATKKVEKELIAWCEDKWANNKKLSRGIIIRQALRIDKDFCGRNFYRLKSWFYYGFKGRMKLSRRVISSTGQKLPKDWEEKHAAIVRKVAGAQMPSQRGDGSISHGVSDKRMGNTDQVPFWFESYGRYQWGRRENHHRRMVATAGMEKKRFTVQLTCFKNGDTVSSILHVPKDDFLCFLQLTFSSSIYAGYTIYHL
jgi:hypothetical protein